MDDSKIEVSESAREKLAEYVKDHPEALSIRVYLQTGG